MSEMVQAKNKLSNENNMEDNCTLDEKSTLINNDINNIFEELKENIPDTTEEKFINKNLFENTSNINIYQQSNIDFISPINTINEERITEEDLYKIEQIYYPINNYGELIKKICKNNLIICYGKKKIGKYTTVLHALLSTFPNKKKLRLYNINNFTDLLKYPSKNTCYIIEVLNSELLINCNYQLLDNLNVKFHSLDSELIIILSVEHISENLIDKDYLFHIAEIQDKYKVILNHIDTYNFKEFYIKEKMLQILNTHKIRNLIQTKLYLREIESLLLNLERELLSGNDVEKLLFDFLDVDIVSNEVRQLLCELKDSNNLDYLFFAITLSILQNYTYREIVKQAETLKLIVLEEQDETLSSKNIFEANKKEKIEKIRAEIILKPINRMNLQKELIRFHNPYYANELIKIIWLEYDLLCPKLEVWFKQLPSQFNLPLIHTLLVLIKEDFYYIKSHFIDYWIFEKNNTNEKLMSLLLDFMILDEELHDYALTMWNFLFDHKENYLNMIAIQTLGLNYGRQKPKVSINKLFNFHYIDIKNPDCLEYAINLPYKNFIELKEVSNKLTYVFCNLFSVNLDTRRYMLKKITYSLNKIQMYCKGDAILINISIKLFYKETYYKNIKVPTIIKDYSENNEYKVYVREIIYRIIDNLYQKNEIEKLLTNYILNYANIEIIYSLFFNFFLDLLNYCIDVKKDFLIGLFKKILDIDKEMQLINNILSNNMEDIHGK